MPTRQTRSLNVPDRIKIALLKQEYENQKYHLAMKDNYTDFREKHFKNEHQIKDEELLRTNTELSKSTAEKERMERLLVAEQKLTRQLQEDGRKQQAVVEELLRKDLWNREQKQLREAVKEKNHGVIQDLRVQVIKGEGAIAQQDMQKPHHLGKLLVRKQEYTEEQQISALGNCQVGTVVAGGTGTGSPGSVVTGSPGPSHCRLVEKLLSWGQLPGLSSSDCSRLVMKLRAERGGLTGLAMGMIEGEVRRLAREEEEDFSGVVGLGE